MHCALFAAYFFFTEPCISPILHIFLYNPTRIHTGARWGGVKWFQFHPGCWYCADFVFSGPWVSCGLTKKVNLLLEIPRDGVCGSGSSVGRAVHVRPHGCLIGQLVPLLLLLTACLPIGGIPAPPVCAQGPCSQGCLFFWWMQMGSIVSVALHTDGRPSCLQLRGKALPSRSSCLSVSLCRFKKEEVLLL